MNRPNRLTGHPLRPAVFLDRDGTLNVDTGYVHRIADFKWTQGAREAIALLNRAGYLVFVVTNQSGIARGYYDCAAVDALHHWMLADLAQHGGRIDDICYCPHHPQGEAGPFATSCNCRKPAPGMLQVLIEKWQPDLSRSCIFGDSQRDIEAGQRAGISGVLITEGNLLEAVGEFLDGTPAQ